MEQYGYLEDPQNFVFVTHSLLSIGIPIYIFGGYCILFKTPKTMTSVKSSMLLLHVWSCWLDICICFLFIPYTLYPSSAGFPLGIMMYLKIPPMGQIYFGASFAGVAAISVLGFFENRYNAVVLSHQMKSRSRNLKRTFYMMLNYFTCFLFFLPPSLSSPPDLSIIKMEIMQKYPFIRSEWYDRPGFFVFPSNFIISISCIPFMISVTLQCLFFVITTSMSLLQHKAKSSSTYKLQKQFFIIMCVQVTLPVTVFIIPVFYNLPSVIYGYYNQSMNCLMIILRGLHGLLSTIVMILVHKPYRAFLFPFFRFPVSYLSSKQQISSNNMFVTS